MTENKKRRAGKKKGKKVFLTFLFLLVFAAAVVVGILVLKHRIPKDSYTTRAVTFERDGLTINARLYEPKDKKKEHPLVIIGHGFGSNMENCADAAALYTTYGISACVFDFCGGSPESTSEGKMTDNSILTEVADMEAVLDGLRERPGIDTGHVFLSGQSQGGLVAALLGAKRQEDTAGLVLFYPAMGMAEAAKRVSAPEDWTDGDIWFSDVTLGKVYFEDALKIDAYSAMISYTKPVVIVQGDSDKYISVEASRNVSETYPDASLVVIEDGKHGFGGERLEKAVKAGAELITSWSFSNGLAGGNTLIF